MEILKKASIQIACRNFQGSMPVVRILYDDTIVGMLLSASLWIWVARIAIFLVCLFAIAMIVESWG
ncbi:hypothetical protein [Nostoc sp.]|uniref:hypothetical protein n=1 Tax=Nostoc sp. TaxID=1180 RepID=UPI002FFB9644